MKNTGFSEINEQRLLYHGIDPWYIEIAITGKCNFHCEYCNRFSCNVNPEKLTAFLKSFNKCRHIQITGGEPTFHIKFCDIVNACRTKASHIGLSTNGTWGIENYINCGADMFSISLDDYDLEILKNRGYIHPELIIETIQALSQKYYVNVGLVIDSKNITRIEDIISFILKLGVHDIKLSTSTKDELMPIFNGDYSKYPILKYRTDNFNLGKQMRGNPDDKCYIAEHDISIVGDKHYPCLVYFREGGKEIGDIGEWIIMKQERMSWINEHNPKKDKICSRFCMDFKCEFNRAVADI